MASSAHSTGIEELSDAHSNVSSLSPAPLEMEPEMSADISSTDSPQSSLPSRELPDDLIAFVAQQGHVPEPPRKRQKTASGSRDTGKSQELEYIVVKQSTWDIYFASSKTSGLKSPVQRSNIRPYIHWNRWSACPEYLEIVDGRNRIFHEPLPTKKTAEDMHIALLVDHQSSKWAKEEGKLWTEFGVSLFQRDGYDTLVITFTVKWNTTSSPYNMHHAKSQTEALTQVLAKYFPNSNVTKSENWSPQDFYQSVHAPNKNDEVAASMFIDGLESTLFPFQKRAVQWLLRREGVEWCTDGQVQNMPMSSESGLPHSFTAEKDALGQPCYISHLFGAVTSNIAPFIQSEQRIKGGILAEEMGLGKTVEMISLITLHRRPGNTASQVYDEYTGTNLRTTGATLIIAPPSILAQWISEINKHAPQLKVMHYKGIKMHHDSNSSEFLDELAGSDIVITTYFAVGDEIHFTPLNPEKTLRQASKYPRPKSPLMQLSWWRCLIDEAQMIESCISNAAIVARMIPRINAWCVTGTPVRKNVNDLLGLLVFLRHEPYASVKRIWAGLISSHKYEFRKLFGKLALRHSKKSVRDELKLPAQRRYVITMPFTPVEEQHYRELFEEMCADVGLNTEGTPLSETWEPDSVAENMRRWLVRLRQTALHPEVGNRNKKALGQKDRPLRTIDQVLDAMMEQADLAIRTDQRTLLAAKLKRGQLFENSPLVKQALTIWEEAAQEAAQFVEEYRVQLHQEIVATRTTGKSDGQKIRNVSEVDSDSADEQEDVDPSSRLGVFRNRLRGALEMLHMAVFFRANAHFQIKSNEEMTVPNSPEFEALEKLETDGYDEAKRLRREILQEIFRKANRLMKKVSKKATTQTFTQIPEFPSDHFKGGIESRMIMEKLDTLASSLDAQANVLDEWREQTVQLLLRSLVDEDERAEITGDEYEDSTKIQDEVMVYVQALGAVIADRHDALTGQENELIKYDVKTALRWAKEGGGAFPEKTIELLKAREEVKPQKTMGSVRGIVAELRAVSTSLKTMAQNGNSRAQTELTIVQKQLEMTQKQLSAQLKVTDGLEKEIALFTSVMNTRVEYYRQLQQVSDMVAPYEGPNDDQTIRKFLKAEEKLQHKISTAKAKRRYLDHLRMEATNPQEQRICVICREDFEIGALTVCGHQYCKGCIRLWWNAHRNCPVCKRKLVLADLHEITYKPQELIIQAEEVHDTHHERTSSSLSLSRKSAIYSEISKTKLAEIKKIELDGPSFTTKVDTLVRHLMWLRESDPGAKSIIYSQFKDFLDVLASAFSTYRIGFSSVDKPKGITRFKQDPAVECFLLHARAHSSGLNLVNASHVFLCEPLLNTALELQAIARVDRIGQHQETNVWLYLVDGTVEESIHQLSVKRRMEHMDQHLSTVKGKKPVFSDEDLDTTLDEANSMELQQASLSSLLAKPGKGRSSAGEMVAKEDLWECLFGGVEKRNTGRALANHELGHDEEVGRFLRAEAAEERASGSGTRVDK